MRSSSSTKWDTFLWLCKIIGACDSNAANRAYKENQLPRLYEMAGQEDVLPALAARLDSLLGNRAKKDSPILDLLSISLRRNIARNMQICAQALKLTEQLNQSGVIPLFLKGTISLLSTDTANLGFRKQVDIDVLVEPAELETAAQALIADGYGFINPTSPDPVNSELSRDIGMAARQSRHHHHLTPLVKPAYSASVEIHRHFLPKRFQKKLHPGGTDIHVHPRAAAWSPLSSSFS